MHCTGPMSTYSLRPGDPIELRSLKVRPRTRCDVPRDGTGFRLCTQRFPALHIFNTRVVKKSPLGMPKSQRLSTRGPLAQLWQVGQRDSYGAKSYRVCRAHGRDCLQPAAPQARRSCCPTSGASSARVHFLLKRLGQVMVRQRTFANCCERFVRCFECCVQGFPCH